MSDENKEQTFAGGKYASVEELEKGYLELQKKLSAGEHKKAEPEPAKQPAAADIAKAAAAAVKEALAAEKKAAAEEQAASVKKYLKDTPDAALSIKKLLHSEDGKKEAAFIDRVEKGDVQLTEVKLMIDQGKDLQEPPNFIEQAILNKNKGPKGDEESLRNEYYSLLDDPKLLDPDHVEYKKKVDRMHKLQEELGLPKEDFHNAANWESGISGEEDHIDNGRML